jgi:hypothetical protein
MSANGAVAGKILGVSVRYYPMQGEHCRERQTFHQTHLTDPGGDVWCDDPPVTRTVLVAGDIGDYACYVGHGTPEWVARHGDKISFEEACLHFPGGQLEKEKYRS